MPYSQKGDNPVINNYSPVSLLPNCEKMSERLIFDCPFEYIEEHKLLSANQFLELTIPI